MAELINTFAAIIYQYIDSIIILLILTFLFLSPLLLPILGAMALSFPITLPLLYVLYYFIFVIGKKEYESKRK